MITSDRFHNFNFIISDTLQVKENTKLQQQVLPNNALEIKGGL